MINKNGGTIKLKTAFHPKNEHTESTNWRKMIKQFEKIRSETKKLVREKKNLAIYSAEPNKTNPKGFYDYLRKKILTSSYEKWPTRC